MPAEAGGPRIAMAKPRRLTVMQNAILPPVANRRWPVLFSCPEN